MEASLSNYLQIPLAEFRNKLLIKEMYGERYVWDIVRKRWIKLKQEEFIRQLFIHFLGGYFPLGRIAVEKNAGLKHKKRIDLAVLDHQLEMLLLIELKDPKTPISTEIIFQAGIYQHQLRANYLLISNGVEHLMWNTHHENGPSLIKEWPFQPLV